jgi:hypothetical protein
MKHPRALVSIASILISFDITAGCGSVQQDQPPGDDELPGDDAGADADPGPDPTPDAAIEPTPDAPPLPDCACTQAKPVCWVHAQSGSGCSVDSDCAAYPGTVCGPTQTCVACVDDAACTVSEPVCSSGMCGGCSVDADCGQYAATPNCDPGGACVECVNNADCGGTSPVCDTNECRGCQSGSECASGECHLDTGACYAANELIYLSPTGDNANPCTKSAKCETFSRALQLVTATKHTITLAPGSYAGLYDGITTSLDVLGHGATYTGHVSVWAGTSSFTDLVIDSGGSGWLSTDTGATARFEHITTNNFVFSYGDITLIDVAASGSLTSTGMLTVEGSTFTDGNGSFTINGGWDITNSIFARNAEGITFSTINASLPHRFDNNTVVDNYNATVQNQTLDLKCMPGVTGSYRNNIVWSSFAPGAYSSVTMGCPLTYSLVYNGTSTPYPGTGNVAGSPAFVRPAPVGSLPADFHLTSTSVARDTGDPANPLANDLDGDARPVGPRADIGADEYAP